MTELPWNRFPTDAPEPELPYTPSEPPPPVQEYKPRHAAPEPETPTSPDWGAVLDEAWPVIRDQVVDYAKGVVSGVVSGQTVDLAHPTVTAVTDKGRELVIADAKSRSWRTLAQGLAFDVIAAIVVVISTLSGADLFNRDTWIAFGILLGKSVVSAVISYFMRLRIAPTMKVNDEKMAVMPVPRPILEQEGRQV